MRNLVSLVILTFMFASPLGAKEAEEKAVVADTPEKFEVLVSSIREEMAPGKRYEFLSTRNQATVNQNLDLMGKMLERAGSVANMDDSTQMELLSIQEETNGILARNAEDRLVCTYVAPVGTHIPKKTCHTVRQLAENRRKFRSQLGDLQKEQLSIDGAATSRFNGNDAPGGN
ncbi:hypothetical protein [Dokdonella sp.]|uniref:hypothetical protein n=1 Tax=Dokdonella sp. TaxID=2291710 RepID=UPI003527806E